MSCKHPSLFQNMCVVCGMKVQQTAPPNSSAARSGAGQPNGWKLAMNVSGGKVLQLSAEEAASVTASKVSNLKNSKKLALVLDLDHTLLHAVQIEGQTPSRTSATARVIEGTVGVGSGDGLEDNVVHHLPIEEIDRMTVKHLVMKKRPFLDEFLEKASEFCQMTVYTAGTRRYAEAVAKVVDPTRRYFADRIVARCDVANIRADGNDKSLERIYPGDASMAVIIDDREDVWRGPQGQQLLMVKPFVHFDPRPSEAAAAATGKPGENASAPLADALGTISRGASVVGNGAAAAVLSPVITLCSSPTGEPAGRIAKVAPLYSFEHSCLDDQLRRCLQVLLDIHAQFYSTPGTSNNGAESGSDVSNTTSVESKSEGNGNGGSAAPTPPPPPSSTNSSALAALSLQQPLQLPSPPSVGNILRGIKKKVLAGCTLTFSGLIPTNEENPRNHSLWRLAEALGAQVSLELLPRTTHLISVHTQTLKVTAVLQKRASEVWVLHPDWLIYCRWSLSRACEATFMLNQLAPGQAQPSPVMDFSPLPASALPPPLHSGAVRKESLVDVPQAAAGLVGRDSSEQLRSSLKRGREEEGRAPTHTNGARPTAPEEDNSMMSTLKKLKAVGHTSNGGGGGNSGNGRDAQAFIRRPNGAFPPIPTPITTGGDQNGGSATNRGPSPTSSSASSSARSQLFAQSAGANAASAATASSTASSGGGSGSGSGAPMGIIKKKVVGIYLEDSPRGRAEGTKSLAKPLGEEKSYLVPYDAGSGEDDYFSAAAMATDAPAPSPRDSASQRDRRSDSEGSGGHAPVFNDNDVLSDSEDGEVREGQDGGASSSSDDNSLAGSGGSGARRRGNRANKHRGGRRSSDGETEDGYYLGSGGEEEEEEEDQQEQDPSDEGMLCCNDDQGSTCSATGSSYLLEDEEGDEEGEGDGEERGGGKRWRSTGSRRSGIEERDSGFGDDNSRRAHFSNPHTFLSNSSGSNVTSSDAHSRAAAARRSDSNSSMSNHSSSDDDGSDFEDMMNRRRLLTGGGSGSGGTIVEAEDDEDADFGYSDGQE